MRTLIPVLLLMAGVFAVGELALEQEADATGQKVTGQPSYTSRIVGTSGKPSTPASGSGCGTASSPVASGTNLSGRAGITCGTTGTAGQPILYMPFNVGAPYTGFPVCMLAPANAAAAALAPSVAPFASPSPSPKPTNMLIWGNGTGLPSGTYLWNFTCTQ